MLTRIGRFVVRRRRAVLCATLAVGLAATVATADLGNHLGFEVFVDKDSDAYAGQQLLEERFRVGPPNVLLLVTATHGSVDDPRVETEARRVVERLAGESGITDVRSYWTNGKPAELRSTTGDRALVIARIPGNDKTVNDRIGELGPRYVLTSEAITVDVGGYAELIRELDEASEQDRLHGEMLAVPLLLVALLFVYGSVVAASLPLVVAAVATVGSGLLLRGMVEVTPVGSFATTFTTTIGLGLAVDYSLFILSRYREELAAGKTPDDAVVETVRTAGRTVLFSAAAVIIALSGLVLVPLNFTRSIAYGGIATAMVAGLASIVVLPAMLGGLGHAVNRWTVFRRSAQPPTERSFWHRAAMVVMRRPVLVAVAGIALLLAAGMPGLRFSPGLPDDRELRAGSHSRDVGDVLRTEFDARPATPLFVVIDRTDDIEITRALRGRIAELPHVIDVSAPESTGSTAFLTVVTDTEPVSAASEELIRAIRAISPAAGRMLVTGEAATLFDVKEAVVGAMPATLAFVAVATFLVLLLQFGSLLVPLKAVLLNILSMSVLFGFIVWVFQDGHLGGVFDFTASGTTYVVIPVLTLCLAFGLSMDYEVFLLSRIKEEYDRTGDNESAIAFGLGRSGRIVTAAALLITVVFLSIGLIGHVRLVKLFGLGLALVVLVDAFVIRATLVPALMKLAGRANWWAPRWMRRAVDQIGLRELEPTSAGQPARQVVSFIHQPFDRAAKGE